MLKEAGYELVLSEKSSVTNSPKKFAMNAETSCVKKFEMIEDIAERKNGIG